MAARSNAALPQSPDRVLIIERIFDAPRELVFQAFTDPERLMKWWGPRGCTVIFCEADPKAGGKWSICMRSPRILPQFVERYPTNAQASPPRSPSSGRDRPEHEDEWIVEKQRGVYQEVVKPERLVFTYGFEDDTGGLLHQTIVTINFADEGGRTRLTLHQAIFESVSARDDHVRGWSEALDQLADHLMNIH